MNRTFNILLVVGCILSIAAAFVISVKPAGTTAAPIAKNETTVPLSLPPLDTTNSPSQSESGGIARRLQLKTNIPERPNDKGACSQ
ncbi:MAG: hypothetical protein JNM55_09610 [Anaerolineales bacterium]|nr:hypothetical protein [Anaerolineales bacterium]